MRTRPGMMSPSAMMVVRAVWVVWVAATQPALSYNLDVGLARVLSGENGTHFGYSVALWNDMNRDKRLVIGAPMWRGPSERDSVISPALGQLMMCRPPSYNCQHYARLPGMTGKTKYAVNRGKVNKQQGIGFTEALYTSTSDAPSSLVACAPRHTTVQPTVSRGAVIHSLFKRGACYLLNSTDSYRSIIPFSSTKLMDSGKIRVNNERYTGQGLAGFSVALNEAQTHMYIGSPNSYRGQGVIAQTTRKEGEWKLDKVSKSKRVNNTLQDFSYEGWAVAVGRFNGRDEAVAVSIPEAPILAGKVLFYNATMDFLEAGPLEGEDAGDKFGFSLASGDLDGDNSTDLVVGAPLASGTLAHEPDRGKVYIFYSPTRKDPPAREPLVLTSGSGTDGGRFGWTLVLADLNQDGFHDVVVGEPGGEGAIYVFSGGVRGVSPMYSQRISGSQLPVQMLGFGLSLTSGTDMDANGYPDVLVGAPLVDKAVFIRTAPVLTLTGDVRFDPPDISLANKTCELETGLEVVCFDLVMNLTYLSRHPLGPFEMTIELTLDRHEGRAHFVKEDTFMIAVNKVLRPPEEPSEEWSVQAYIKPGRPRLDTPLEVSVRALMSEGVEENETTTPTPTTASPDLTSSVVPPVVAPLTLEASAPLMCPPEVICLSRTDLRLSVNGSSPLNIGEGDVALQVGIEPLEDNAYRVQLSLTYPVQLTFQRVSGDQLIPKCVAEVESQGTGEVDQLQGMMGQGQLSDRNSSLLTCNFTSQFKKDAVVLATFHFTYNINTMLHFLASADVLQPDVTSTYPDSLDPVSPDIGSDFTSPNPSLSEMTSPEPSFPDSITSSDQSSPNSTSADPSSLVSTSPRPTSPNSTSPVVRLPVSLLPHLPFHVAVISDLPDLNSSDNSLVVNKTVYSMINLQLLGQSQPDTVEGMLNRSASVTEVIYNSRFTAPSYLGPKITHTFSLTNLGPSPLMHAKLNINLPLHLKHGVPLLYLMENPRLQGNISCSSLPLNPINYTFTMYNSSMEGEDAEEGEEWTTDSSENGMSDVTTPSEDGVSSVTTTPAASTVTTSTPTYSASALKLFDVDFSLRSNARRRGIADCNMVPCETMTCEVEGLEVEDGVSVEVSGYAVLASLVEVAGGGLVQIRSDARVEVDFEHSRQLVHPETFTTAAAPTQVLILGKRGFHHRITLDELPWWWYLVVAAVSLFIMLIIIIVCVKVGFFKRDRVERVRRPTIRGSGYRRKNDDEDFKAFDSAEMEDLE